MDNSRKIESKENHNLQIPIGYMPPQTLDDYKQELESLKSNLSFTEKELAELKDYTKTSFGVYIGVLFLTTFINIDKYAIITLAIFGCLIVLSSNMRYTRDKLKIENSIDKYKKDIKTTKNKISKEKKELKKQND